MLFSFRSRFPDVIPAKLVLDVDRGAGIQKDGPRSDETELFLAFVPESICSLVSLSVLPLRFVFALSMVHLFHVTSHGDFRSAVFLLHNRFVLCLLPQDQEWAEKAYENGYRIYLHYYVSDFAVSF